MNWLHVFDTCLRHAFDNQWVVKPGIDDTFKHAFVLLGESKNNNYENETNFSGDTWLVINS